MCRKKQRKQAAFIVAKFIKKIHYDVTYFENSPSPGKSPAAADRLIMARGSEPRPKVIKIPILIEDNNSGGQQQQQQQQQQQAGCGNWPLGGHHEEAAAAAASWRTAGEQSGRREAAGGARTRIIPIRLSDDDRLSSTDGHSPVIVASGGEGTGVGAAHGRQRPGGSDTAAAGGVSGLRARLAGSRANSVEEAARPSSSVKVEIGGSSARRSATSPLPPSSNEMAETLVKASSASASDIWYVKKTV
jgi:hypothetical protein